MFGRLSFHVFVRALWGNRWKKYYYTALKNIMLLDLRQKDGKVSVWKPFSLLMWLALCFSSGFCSPRAVETDAFNGLTLPIQTF